MPKKVDVLIIGSGFGGSVMAAELARAKKTRRDGTPISICLVERGRAYPPGSFPRDPAGVSRNFWDPLAGLYGMFDVWSFDHMDAVISSGLGGGSLIYANVMLPKDKEWFTQRVPFSNDTYEDWLLKFDDVKCHYQEILKFLRVQELPHAPGDPIDFDLAKTKQFLKKPAGGTHVEDVVGYAPLAVRFRGADGRAAIEAPLPKERNQDTGEEFDNIHGDVLRTTCTLVAECDVGCNQGAKNTLDHTYLSEASHNGASIHTLTEVVKLEHLTSADDYRFNVTVALHQTAPESATDDVIAPETLALTHIRARRVVLAAGTFGTTQLLLKNARDLGVEDPTTPDGKSVLGSRFSGNGDNLAFVWDVPQQQPLEPTKGPVITAYRQYPADTDPPDNPDNPDTGRDGRNRSRHGMYLQDAGFPEISKWFTALANSGALDSDIANFWLRKPFVKLPDVDSGRMAGPTTLAAELDAATVRPSFFARLMPLLGMGRERADGRLSLDETEETLECSWTVDSSESFYYTMRQRMEAVAQGLGGKLLWNPLYRFFHRGITVHPIGGCPMDTTRAAGVVDTFGRVRGVPGLRVCDGSVFPGAIGPNPSLTIAAFSRRSAHNLLDEPDFAAAAPHADCYEALVRRHVSSKHVDPEE
ncbi:MAG: GMC oxidoreductase [Actinomycetota bacterium]|nr:GMC oxidoreductase [Actinomycetota bacterium]